MSDPEIFKYWLTTSAISFTGACTTITPGNGDKPKKKYQSAASLTNRADISKGAVSLAIKDGRDDNKLSLGLADDGRLTSSDLDSTGEGSVLLGAVVSIVTAAVTTAAIVLESDSGTPT